MGESSVILGREVQDMKQRSVYSDWMTLEQARDTYFRVNGFGADGGYNDPWVDFKVGPIPWI